jgi:hypothetical protein
MNMNPTITISFPARRGPATFNLAHDGGERAMPGRFGTRVPDAGRQPMMRKDPL